MPISNEEFDQLDAYLMSEATPDETMDLEMLDGFLVCLAIGPEGAGSDDWLPEVFGGETPVDLPSNIHELIMRQAEEVASHFSTAAREKQPEDEPLYQPLILQESSDDESWMDTLGQYWAGGFRAAIMLREDDWVEAMDEDEELSDLVLDIMTLELGRHPERTSEVLNRRSREDRVDELPWLVEGVLYRWLERKFQVETVVRDGEKVGRNDPCPCGSGKKFKKCCGADA